MAEVLPGSPAKLERVERHLSRQRGAGVRNLATSFGFSLALSLAPAPTIHPEEPPAKRRKSAQDGVAEQVRKEKPAEHSDGTAVEIKPKTRKVRRRFEAVEEVETTVAARDDRHDSFATTAKKRGRPKKTDTPAVVKEVPPESTVLPQRRPRRLAAASASAKVSEGFAEEAASIDKKRRDPEPERPARRGRKNNTLANTSAADTVTGLDGSNAESRFRESELSTGELQNETTQQSDITGTAKSSTKPPARKRKIPESPPKRIPLEETCVNIRSCSPKKHEQDARKDTAPSPPPENSEKRMLVKTDTKTRKRKVTKVFEGSAIPGSIKKAAASVAVYSSIEGKHMKKTNDDQKQKRNPGRTDASASPVPPLISIPRVSKRAGSTRQRQDNKKPALLSSLLQENSSNKGTAEEGSLSARPKASQPSECATTTKPRARMGSRQPVHTSHEEEDVDWLFEPHEKRSVISRQSRRRPAAKVTRRAKSPEVDLDEMLSNIAFWAPKRR